MCLISTRFIIYGGQWRQWERQAEGDLPAACYPKPSPHTTSKSSWLTSSSPPYPPACLCSIPGFCDVEPSFPLTWSVNIIAPLLWLPFRRELTHRSFLSACSPFSHDSVYWRVKLFLPPGLWLLFFFFFSCARSILRIFASWTSWWGHRTSWQRARFTTTALWFFFPLKSNQVCTWVQTC